MGFGCIAAGMLFLFNPNINVIDILPDFIGYILIYHGLFRMSYATPKLADARGIVWKLSIVTALRLLSLILLPYTSDTFILVLVFVFAVLELMYLLPAVGSLFDGFYALGTRFDADSVFDSRNVIRVEKNSFAEGGQRRAGRRKISRTVEGAERLRSFTYLFLVVKTVTSVLPELTALQLTDDLSSDSRIRLPLSQFKPLFYILCSTVVLIVGIIWVVSMVRYILRMKRDEALNEKISVFYEENVASRPSLVAAYRMKRVQLLLSLAAIASFMLILDGVNILPNIFSAALLIFALSVMLRYDRRAAGGILLCAVTVVMSVINVFLQIPYFEEYEAMSAQYIRGAEEMYAPIFWMAVVEYVFVALMFVYAIVMFARMTRMHVQYIDVHTSSAQYSVEDRRREIIRPIRGRLIAAGIFAFLNAASAGAYYFVSVLYPAYLTVHTLLSIVWIVIMVQAMSVSNEHLYERLEQDY